MTKSWIEQNYPIGLEVEVLGEGPGTIESHTVEVPKVGRGLRTSGIIVQHSDNSRTEVEAAFLNEDGSDGPFVQKVKSHGR